MECVAPPPLPSPAVITPQPAELDAFIAAAFPHSESPYRTLSVGDRRIVLRRKVSREDTRPGGTVSGPTMMGLADSAAYLLIVAELNRRADDAPAPPTAELDGAMAVTSSLHFDFLRKPAPGDLDGRGELVKFGRRLAVCRIDIHSVDAPLGKGLVATALVTYAMP